LPLAGTLPTPTVLKKACICERSATGKRGCAGKRWSTDRPGSDSPCKCNHKYSCFDHSSNSNFWTYVRTTCAFLVRRTCQLLGATLCCHSTSTSIRPCGSCGAMWFAIYGFGVIYLPYGSQTDPKTLVGKAVICDEDLECHLAALKSTRLACANGAANVLNRYCCCAEHAEHPVSACWAYSSWHRYYVLASNTPLCTQIVFTIIRTSTRFQTPGSTAIPAAYYQSRFN